MTMGDHADDIINGFTCACGEMIDGEEPGYPRYCSDQCKRDYGGERVTPKPAAAVFNSPVYASKTDKNRAKQQRRRARQREARKAISA